VQGFRRTQRNHNSRLIHRPRNQWAIIDIFVNAIYLYDDKIVLTYSFKADSRTISLSDVECSDLPQSFPSLGTNANPVQFFIVWEAFAFDFPFD